MSRKSRHAEQRKHGSNTTIQYKQLAIPLHIQNHPHDKHPKKAQIPKSDTNKPTMSLFAFISNIWAGLSPAAPTTKRRSRRIANIDPDSIEPINHWFPGNRAKKQPRRLVETPTAGHWPEHRVAKSVVGKGRKRCSECGSLVKEAPGAKTSRAGGVGKASGQRKVSKKTSKKAGTNGKGTATRNLRGRVVEL